MQPYVTAVLAVLCVLCGTAVPRKGSAGQELSGGSDQTLRWSPHVLGFPVGSQGAARFRFQSWRWRSFCLSSLFWPSTTTGSCVRAVPTADSACKRCKRGLPFQVSKWSTGPRGWAWIHSVLRLLSSCVHCCKPVGPYRWISPRKPLLCLYSVSLLY